MTQKERMEKGLVYYCNDDKILGDQVLCLEKLYDYNATRPLESKRRAELLKDMFAEVGEGAYIEPPLHANWGGKRVHLGKNVYAKIIGWDLYNSYAESNLVKNIEDYTIGINWNDPNNFRSYWATCNGNAALVNEVDYDALNEYYTHLYCGENTRGNLDADASLRTKIFFKAQLQDEDGGAIEVARWFGNDYVGEENLLKAVKSTISNTYYYGLVADGVTTYKSIEDTDLKTVAGGDGDGGSVKAYQVYFQLSDQGTAKSWYKLVNGEFVDVTATLNGELKTYISPALLYKEGQTYYYTDIEHLKSASATTYGVVRNHIYDVTVKTISGLGTPVADEDITIEVPETPAEDAKTYLAAEINILSWRLVSNDVDL